MRLIPLRACQRQRWKNGGGWTTEIARAADPASPAGDFRWRVSIAEIGTDGPFSSFPGVDRDLVLLEGAGMELVIGAAEPVFLAERFARVRFDGALPVACRLLDGATRDFNVMVRRGLVAAELWVRPLVGTLLVPPSPPRTEWLVHVFSGQATARQDGERLDLAAGDSLHLEQAGNRVLLEGAGELVVVRFGTPA
jgi:environmental stress-induced protein Ves